MGYAGGKKAHPTYHSLGDHTETLQIDYDPTRITYRELLDLFWKSHSPERKPSSRQYMSVIFHHGDEQRKLALASRQREAERRKAQIHTPILPAPEFWLAEDYHQRYYLQRVPALANEFRAIYPETRDFAASTAAARVNGYVAGHGTLAALKKGLDGLGLSPEASKWLLEHVRTSTPSPACAP